MKKAINIPITKNCRSYHDTTNLPAPKILKQRLDEYIIGQDKPKKILSVGVYNHYLKIKDREDKRQQLIQLDLLKKRYQNELDKIAIAKERAKNDFSSSDSFASESLDKPSPTQEFEVGLKSMKARIASQEQKLKHADFALQLGKSNIMLIGPSGSGKTMLTSTMAKNLHVPISMSDCTQLTQAGYTGDDVHEVVKRLLINSNYNKEFTEKGIIVLDEVDKLAKNKSTGNGGKDVSGEGVQQSLLKLLEGHQVEFYLDRPVDPKEADRQLRKTGVHSPMTTREHYSINTENILFILSGAFVGLDKIVYRRVNPHLTEEEFENIKNYEFIISADGTTQTPTLSLAQPEDLVAFGLIPEMIGRVPIVTALEPLQETDLYNILSKPKNSFVKQYEYIFQKIGIDLKFTSKALKKISKWALTNKTGARGLKSILERVLLECNYDCPESGVRYILINEKNVNHIIKESGHSLNTGECEPIRYYSRADKDEFRIAASLEDPALGKQLDVLFGTTPTHK